MTLTVQQPTGPVEIVTLQRQWRPATYPADAWNRTIQRRGSMWFCELADNTVAILFADEIMVSL